MNAALERLPDAIDHVTAAGIEWSLHGRPVDLVRLAVAADVLARATSRAVEEQLLHERRAAA